MIISLPAEIETARVPELPEHDLLPTMEDRIPIWIAELNSTRQIKLSSLRLFVQPSSESYTPVQLGPHLLYEVPEEKAGDDWVDIPAIAGMNFSLVRDMMPLKPGEEFEILSTGGFRLLNDSLILGQRYVLTVFELSDGAIPGTGSGSSGVAGKVLINTNYNVLPADAGKIHQIRGGANALDIVLPDVDNVPVNSVFIFESIITNTKQSRISTTSDQYIYLNNESVDELFIGKGEKMKFFRDVDGWYLIDGEDNFKEIGRPFHDYKVRLNTFVAQGQLLLRAEYPRLWKEVQSMTGALVTDAQWNTASVIESGRTYLTPFKGCFSSGTNSTNFRVPDLLNSAFRSLKNIGGSDTERHHNNSGGYQEDQNRSHGHNININRVDSGGNGTSPNPDISTIRGSTTVGDTGIITPGVETIAIQASGGTETTMKNVGLLPLIKY